VLSRALDETYPSEVRANITLLTVARLTTNSAFRYVIPFLGVVARGLDVSVAELGVALTVAELSGLSGSALGRLVDRIPRSTALAVGLGGLVAGTVLAAVSHHVVVFAAALVVIAVTKFTFDLGLLGWISDHVPIERRGRVIGITETAWAGGLFVGAAVLGAVTAIWSWRWAYATAALWLAVLLTITAVRLPPERVRSTSAGPEPRARLDAARLVWVAGMGLLMLASQLLFVVMGPWLEDEHGFSAGGIAVFAFALGVLELGSSSMSAHVTDRWGGRRAVTRGGLLLVPATALFAAGQSSLPVGLAALGLMVLGFEFAIVSGVSVASNLVPRRPAAGIGLMLTAGTLGRAAGAVLGTWLYERHGAGAPSWIALAAAVGMVVLSAWTPGATPRSALSSLGRPGASGAP